jgi:hypothetical protein
MQTLLGCQIIVQMDHLQKDSMGKTGAEKGRIFLLLVCFALLLLALSSCDPTTLSSSSHTQNRTFTGSSTQPITYSSSPSDVLIRTFYGGGLQGSFSFGPQVSIYGDGSYILGLDRQGKLTTEELQQLLNVLVNTYGVLSFSQQRFSDVQDENATFLELAFNGKQEELIYGTSSSDQDEYQRLGQALTAINEALKGPTQPYKASAVSLLTRQTFSPDLHASIPSWPLTDFTLAQAAVYECGPVPPDETSRNAETACLKFAIPEHAILLNGAQVQSIKEMLTGVQGDFTEQGLYYTVFLRPLLPDEVTRKMLAMFGSDQEIFRGVPLLSGKVPSIPSQTAS